MPYLGNPSPAHTHTNPVFPLAIVLTIQQTVVASTFTVIRTKTRLRSIADSISTSGIVALAHRKSKTISEVAIALSTVLSRIAIKRRGLVPHSADFLPADFLPADHITEPYGEYEVVTLSETVDGFRLKIKSLAESIATSGTIALAKRTSRSIASTLGISEVLTRPTRKFRPLADVLTSGDLLTRVKKYATKILTETITIGELLNGFKLVPTKLLTETVTLSQALTKRKISKRSIAQAVTVSESLVRNFILKIRSLAESIITSGVLTKIARKVQPLFESILSTEVAARQALKFRQTTQNAYSILFNGTNQYINAGTSTVFKVAEALGQSGSFSFWVYIAANPSATAYIFARGIPNSSYGIRVSISTIGVLTVQVLHSNNTGGTSTAGALTTGVWNHVAITINASNNEVKGYVNATLKFTRTTPVLPLHNSDGNGDRFLIGARAVTATTQTEYLPGLVDGFRLYDRVLTPAEVNVLSAGYNVQTGLTVWFKMNEGFGTTTRDDVGGIIANLINTPTWSSNFPTLYYENIFLSETLNKAKLKVKSLTSSITTTGALSRIKKRYNLLIDFVGISDILNRIKKVSFRSLADSLATSGVVTVSRRKVTSIAQTVTTTGVLNVVQRIKARTITDAVSITDALNRISTKIRSIASSIATSGVLSKGIGITKQIAQSISTTGALTRQKTLARAIADAISTTGIASILSTIFLSIAESITTSGVATVMKQKATVITQAITTTAALTIVNRHKFRSIAQSILLSTVLTARRIFLAGVTWVIAGKTTDFEDKIETMTMAYVEDNWRAIVIPAMASGTNYSNEVTQNEFKYDGFRTYYIRVKEGVSQVDNRQTRANLYTFSTPVEFEVSVRRLSKGESFPDLNNMINELLRIFGQYQEDEIFGVKGVTFDSITPIERNGTAYRSLWQKTLKVTLHYYKAAVIQI